MTALRNGRSRLVAGLVVLAGMVAGGSAFAATVTLNFVHAQPPDAYATVIAAFEKQHPDIKIQQQSIPFEQLNAQVQARLGSRDTSVDLYGADTPRIPAFARRGFLMDLSSLRPAIEAVASPSDISAVSAGGKIWALPEWTSTQLLFYNKELLQKAGVTPPPSDPKERLTWKALLDAARKVKAAGGRWGFSFEQVDRYYQLQPLYTSAGAGPGLTGPDLMQPAVTTDQWIATTEWYHDLFTSGLSPRGITPEQIPDLFTNGELAFLVAGPWNLGSFNQASKLRYGIAPMPYFATGKPATPTDSWAVGISPYTEHKDETLAFAKFLTLDPKGALMTVKKRPLPPVNKIAYKTYLTEVTKSGGATTAPLENIITYELANTAVHRPRSVGYVAFEEVMNRAFSDIRNGAEVKPTLERAQSSIRSAFSRIR